MDIFDILLQVGLVTAALVAYLIFFKRSPPAKFSGTYRQPAWNYWFRLLIARWAVRRWKSQLPQSQLQESPRPDQNEGWDCVTIRVSSSDGSNIVLAIRKLCGRQPLAEVTIHVKLPDGTTYKLPQHPDTAVGPWESLVDDWSAGELKVKVLEPGVRLRILYNGLLKRVGDNAIQHVRFNFTWSAASKRVRYPEDWSNSLAAHSLALEPWRDDKWPSTLTKWGNGSWHQWGVIQGRFQSFDNEGRIDQNVYLRTRGMRERSWSLQGYTGLRRSVYITALARDGTAVHLHGFSYNGVLTLGFSGSVRFPDCAVTSITGTDLVLAHLCERINDDIPKSYVVNVSTKNRDLKLVLHINADGGRLLSGAPYQHEVVYRTLSATINGQPGSGLLELNYETSMKSGPSIKQSPARPLKWVSVEEAGPVPYCLPLEAPAAACPDHVGGKGASLALLASVQAEQGYRVPPGYCLTTKALEKHLETNPLMREAIKEIEAANENYDEKNFKAKCDKAVELFMSTEITGEVRDEILARLSDLRMKAKEQNLGPDLRFAVRSSAVGEDSEALSAAGQNETVLGCAGDDDVLRGVQRCWASMFAFTSAYYRRQNGQVCECGGGVVVQALVGARAAGVLFTRHPERGDPSRLLITANYGLGESVVSGSVEPDTIIVSRGTELTISKIVLGSKTQRVTSAAGGVATEDVPEAERATPCLTEAEALRLAEIGVAQEEMWGAGRDIEWAVTKDDIFLLQARPITSLERWTEEELLHELDTAVMADDELVTFANTGEVMPKPITALTYDLVIDPLTCGLNSAMYNAGQSDTGGYDKSTVFSHNRCLLSLYNSVYRTVPKKIDMTIRMLEMAIHGHRVANDDIFNTALQRRQTSWLDMMIMQVYTVKFLLTSKRSMIDIQKAVKELNLEKETNDAVELLNSISRAEPTLLRCSVNHANTSSANVSSQFIAMMVLIEGAADFTQEQCNEINTLLSSGGVLSAEVPQALAALARQLEGSGKVEEFRSQDPKNAIPWLKDNLPAVHQEVLTFLENHGHRAIMEFDLATKPWALVPEEMMGVLQNIRASKEEAQKSKNAAEIVASLKTPKKSSTRKILRWVLPLCQRTVRHREITKANLILAIHKLRIALLRLGRLMVRQWYLPEVDLVFHFRFKELKEYIRTRDPALLKKAVQRRQYYPSWCKLKFAEMQTGWVEPLETKGPAVMAGDVKIKAASVCGGEVIARACVVNDLSEIGQLQRGDILITHSTDIGWSPYFPLLSGIVTELGGLISHGAVIAREYGLPCIVGAENATNIFTTGDMVRLSGEEGVLEKVQLADEPVEGKDKVNSDIGVAL